MRLKRTTYILGICVITWVTVTYYALINRMVFVSETAEDGSNNQKLTQLENSISAQFKQTNAMLKDAQQYLELKKDSSVVVAGGGGEGEQSALPQHKRNKEYKGTVIPVLVFACNRVSVSRCLDQLIQYRPNPDQFPIIVSQVIHFILSQYCFIAVKSNLQIRRLLLKFYIQLVCLM